MNIGTLIALAAKRVFERNDQRLGVRLSPVTLSASELLDAVRELRKLLGPKVYIVGSAPDAGVVELDSRAYVAPDLRAAERATAWRNRLKVDEKERLVYVSVEEHRKANGLRDCLEQVRERDLRDAFREWGAGPKSGLPDGLASALEESDLLATVRLGALCVFAAEIAAAGTKRASAWQTVGDALPIINLARDSKLTKADAASRLGANQALVRAVETGESRRRSAAGPKAEVEAALEAALATQQKGGRRQALASVDLGAVQTPRLAKPKPSRGKQPPPQGKLPTAGAKTRPEATNGKAAKNTGAGAATRRPAAATTAQPDSPTERVIEAAEAENGPEEATVTGPAKASDARPRALTRSPVRLLGTPLPKGLLFVLDRLLKEHGEPVAIIARASDRSIFDDAGKTLGAVTRECARVRAKLSTEIGAWRERRAALVAAVQSLPGVQSVVDALTRGATSLLREPAVTEQLEAFVVTSIALYDAAGELDPRTMREVLALDTIELRDRAGVTQARVIGPLHLLSLGQLLAAHSAVERSRALAEGARRLIARALEAAPAAPGALQEETGELLLARGIAGLLIYERTPELVSASDAQAAARAVTARYVMLAPHALVGLRVAVTGAGDLAPLVEGVASAIESMEPAPERVEVLCERPPSLDPRGAGARAVDAGVLRLAALDAASARGAHVTIRMASTLSRPEDDEAAAPSVKTFAPPGAGRTTFELRAHGLRVRTSVSSTRELAAVEALVARSVGEVPQGAFVTDVAGRSLRAESEGAVADGGWLAIVGRSLGRRPAPAWYLIAHERFGARASCAVVARDVRAAARSLRDGLAALGVSDMRPRALLMLAERLSGLARASLVPLDRPAASLVADGLLSLELRKLLGGGEDVLIAPLTGAVAEALVGALEGEEQDSIVLAAARAAEGIRFVIGYCSVSESPDLQVGKGSLEGGIAKRIARVAEALGMSSGDGADAAAAREAIGWALWTAVAADEAAQAVWKATLTSWTGSLGGPLESLIVLRPAEEENRDRVGKIGRVKATVRPLALDRLNALLLG